MTSDNQTSLREDEPSTTPTFGLLGRTLGHSFSPTIHHRLGNEAYTLFEQEPETLEAFFNIPTLQGLNITIPYKVNALKACDIVDDRARRIGCVNTMVRRNHQWYGYNTDYDGFLYTLERSHIDVAGKSCLILGDGASSKTIHVALEDLGAKEIIHMSRHTYPYYEDAKDLYDRTEVIINATPVGMYPNCPNQSVKLSPFTKLIGVVDLIYNPLKTALLVEAEELGIPSSNGLAFLVAQATQADAHFHNKPINHNQTDKILQELTSELTNIVLIGMPGVGKSTVGRELASTMNRELIDIDTLIASEVGVIGDYILNKGEVAFRAIESRIINEIGKQTGLIISTGGGCVTREENFIPLRQNGRVYQLIQPLESLATEGRVLSRGGIERLREIHAIRTPMYDRFAHHKIHHERIAPDTVKHILDDFYKER